MHQPVTRGLAQVVFFMRSRDASRGELTITSLMILCSVSFYEPNAIRPEMAAIAT